MNKVIKNLPILFLSSTIIVGCANDESKNEKEKIESTNIKIEKVDNSGSRINNELNTKNLKEISENVFEDKSKQVTYTVNNDKKLITVDEKIPNNKKLFINKNKKELVNIGKKYIPSDAKEKEKLSENEYIFESKSTNKNYIMSFVLGKNNNIIDVVVMEDAVK